MQICAHSFQHTSKCGLPGCQCTVICVNYLLNVFSDLF